MAGKSFYKSTVTKSDLVNDIYDRIGFSKKEASQLLEDMFDILKNSILQGESIKISGFGRFEVQYKEARKGRNPQTGEIITIPAKNIIKFKPSSNLKSALNDKNKPNGGLPYE